MCHPVSPHWSHKCTAGCVCVISDTILYPTMCKYQVLIWRVRARCAISGPSQVQGMISHSESYWVRVKSSPAEHSSTIDRGVEIFGRHEVLDLRDSSTHDFFPTSHGTPIRWIFHFVFFLNLNFSKKTHMFSCFHFFWYFSFFPAVADPWGIFNWPPHFPSDWSVCLFPEMTTLRYCPHTALPLLPKFLTLCYWFWYCGR